ncbi:MAG: right-handed parallel beta-helix repeat-containing protein [Thermoplasmata archaeon]|nr:MAG: right-handed parallel beta-helix repeat-containing protein [Thermoplasmata archaeon]
MRRKVSSLGLCFILIIAIFTTFHLNYKFIQTGKCETFYVDDDGGKDYIRIQDAIDNATAGSIIYVWNGTYNENVVVDKSLTIIGNSSMNTTIDANKTGDVMTIQANWVNITGFTLARPYKYKAGIKLDNAENCMIAHNVYYPYYGSSYGIHIYNSRENTIISNNFSKARCGILVNISDNNNIAENELFGNKYGIFLGPSSDNNYIDNNNISNSKILNVDQYGIYIQYSVGNNITQNILVENGIFISGNLIQHWNTHIIDTSNMISTKPIYYWKNRTGGIIPMGAGQIILANCQNVIVKNQELSNSSVGIELGFSLNNDIINNNASGNYY